MNCERLLPVVSVLLVKKKKIKTYFETALRDIWAG